ncbi:nitroreductase family protein [Pseudoroseicyclus tamaricis]|uniref:Putative NAD(P)H nitroreductase n=1 Tax=Pseudoroseicyclus tamaricis TaxID=2705421 RepID=A0A6B2JKY7_9RHOB|nr:nitroreductase [Pseudoroseicyclus tamaricis]NDV02191.1 nitroreductase [Pseudoroseicyclus tamaricis]
MPDRNQPALDFLATRRSRPHKLLQPPVPAREELMELLTIGMRVPDHGKLEPWRYLVLEKQAMTRLAGAISARAEARGEGPAEKIVAQYADASLCVAVICSPKPSEIPEAEQVASAACVCLSLLNACLAAGWGANWLTDWPAFDRPFLEEHLGLSPSESLAGFIHIGTAASKPPERPRPDVSALTTWVAE